jgi:hypothetical protein
MNTEKANVTTITTIVELCNSSRVGQVTRVISVFTSLMNDTIFFIMLVPFYKLAVRKRKISVLIPISFDP